MVLSSFPALHEYTVSLGKSKLGLAELIRLLQGETQPGDEKPKRNIDSSNVPTDPDLN